MEIEAFTSQQIFATNALQRTVTLAAQDETHLCVREELRWIHGNVTKEYLLTLQVRIVNAYLSKRTVQVCQTSCKTVSLSQQEEELWARE